MDKQQKKLLRRMAIALPVLLLALWFVPVIAIIWIVAGLIDVMRNKGRNALMFNRYFFGNGILTWLLAPFNLAVDLISRRNPGIWKMEDFPPEWRAEIDSVLDVFKARREEIMAEIDAKFEKGRRGMYVYRWYGKPFIDTVPEFNREFRYVKTIAVSVFSGKESTTWHYGPLRLSLRLLYNLKPADTDAVFIECNGVRHQWNRDPLYIFDDTLFHRSVNEHDGRRYNVFMDVIRPTPFPGLLSGLLSMVSVIAERIKAVFYKNWTMIAGARKPA
ncbi:MAG TPA: aspartyl/asparaginyl beta-hydroxylase domain-containing protein [Rhizobiaceae bacterium]|nr:aspartyl/asparaginyl beta-hydroxylase domain-containing protein [Rhizobiaceae bacterium]